MISYPGEILARFGRYEAVEDLGLRAEAHVWKSWDPYLERFVLIIVIPPGDQAELHRLGAEVGTLLDRYLGETPRRRILDFAPPGAENLAFFVLEWSAARIGR